MKPGGGIRIVVAEQNDALRDGIVALVGTQSDMRVVSVAIDAPEAFSEIRRIHPEVVIVDVDVPDALDLMRQVRRERPKTKVIALVNYEWDRNAEAASRASDSQCLPKDHISRFLVTLIRQATH